MGQPRDDCSERTPESRERPSRIREWWRTLSLVKGGPATMSRTMLPSGEKVSWSNAFDGLLTARRVRASRNHSCRSDLRCVGFQGWKVSPTTGDVLKGLAVAAGAALAGHHIKHGMDHK